MQEESDENEEVKKRHLILKLNEKCLYRLMINFSLFKKVYMPSFFGLWRLKSSDNSVPVNIPNLEMTASKNHFPRKGIGIFGEIVDSRTEGKHTRWIQDIFLCQKTMKGHWDHIKSLEETMYRETIHLDVYFHPLHGVVIIKKQQLVTTQD